MMDASIGPNYSKKAKMICLLLPGRQGVADPIGREDDCSFRYRMQNYTKSYNTERLCIDVLAKKLLNKKMDLSHAGRAIASPGQNSISNT